MTKVSDLDFVVVLADERSKKLARKIFYAKFHGPGIALDIISVSELEFTGLGRLGGVCLIAAEDGQVIYGRI